jgi:hypothetical protein
LELRVYAVEPDILSEPKGTITALLDAKTVPVDPNNTIGDVTRELGGRKIEGELPLTNTATSVVRTVKLPDATVRGGLETHIVWPSTLRPRAEMSVKIVFQVAERMTAPGTAFSAPAAGVYTPLRAKGMVMLPRR